MKASSTWPRPAPPRLPRKTDLPLQPATLLPLGASFLEWLAACCNRYSISKAYRLLVLWCIQGEADGACLGLASRSTGISCALLCFWHVVTEIASHVFAAPRLCRDRPTRSFSLLPTYHRVRYLFRESFILEAAPQRHHLNFESFKSSRLI